MSKNSGSRAAAVHQALMVLAPRIPAFKRDDIIAHALSAPGLRKASPQAAAWLAMVALIRHVHSDYDHLLADGYPFEAARFFTRETINAVLQDWGCRRQISEHDHSQLDDAS